MIPDLSISIINTDNRDQTLDCLRSIFANTHRVSLEVFVVDNTCTDSSAEAIASEFPQVKLIRNEVRKGFSTNNNLALAQANGRYLMILNDDTVIQPEAFDTLVAFMDTHPEAGACGPKLLNLDGSNQPAFLHFTTPLEELILVPLSSHLRPSKWDVFDVVPTDWVGGGCMLVRRETASQLGLLDTDFDPLYAEERDWCYRIKRAGWKIYHVPTAQVVHLGGQTTRYTSVAMMVRLYRNKLLFYQKHAHPFIGLEYRLLLLGITLVKLLTWGLLYLLGQDRLVAQRKLVAHRQIFRLCLKGI